MNEELIQQRMTALRGLRQRRQLQNAFRRGQMKRGALRKTLTDEFLKSVNMPSPEAYLARVADFTPEQAQFLCAEVAPPTKKEFPWK